MTFRCNHVSYERDHLGGFRCTFCGEVYVRKLYSPPKLTPVDPGKGLECAACGHSSLVHSRALDSSPMHPRFPCAECSACGNFVLRAPPVE